MDGVVTAFLRRGKFWVLGSLGEFGDLSVGGSLGGEVFGIRG